MNWKNSKILKWAIFFALFFFGLFCYMKDRGYCAQYDVTNEIHVDVKDEFLYQHYDFRSHWGRNHNQQSSRSQKQKWQEAYDHHHFNAVRTYTDAYNRVWFLPDLTWRQVGRDAWIAACSMATTKQPTAALVIAFTTMLSQYGLHCLDEWDYIQDKLHWSNYHFEQCAYYAGLLNK